MGRFVSGFVAVWTAVSFTAVCLAACSATPARAAEHACCKKPADGRGARLQATSADCCAQPHMTKPSSSGAPSAAPVMPPASMPEASRAALLIAEFRAPRPPGASPPLVLRI